MFTVEVATAVMFFVTLYSIVNAFIGEDRNIVREIAGTTRDSIYTRYNKFGFDFYLVDTAGIRKKNKVNELMRPSTYGKNWTRFTSVPV